MIYWIKWQTRAVFGNRKKEIVVIEMAGGKQIFFKAHGIDDDIQLVGQDPVF